MRSTDRREFRQRRSTRATRTSGTAAYVFAYVTVLWRQFHFWSSAPRWDLILLMALSAGCGVAWMILSFRAPAVERAETPTAFDKVVWTDGPDIPAGIPAPPRRRAVARGAAVGLLLALSFGFALATAIGPNGPAGRQAGEIYRDGGVEGPVRILAITGAQTMTGEPKGGFLCHTDALVLILTGADSGDQVEVPNAATPQCPDVDDTVEAFYAPTRLDLGARIVYAQQGGAFRGIPAQPMWLFFWFVLMFAGFGPGLGALAVFADIRYPETRDSLPSPPRGAEAMLHADLRHGRARGARAMIEGAERTERIEQGSRIGRAVVHLAVPDLTIALCGGETLKLTPLTGYDPSVIADDFAAAPGWLCWPDRWRLFERGPMPVVFAADDGRILWCVLELDRLPLDRQDLLSQPPVPVDPRKRAVVPRYGRFHPALHVRAAVVLAVGAAAELVRLVTYSSGPVTWVLFPVAVVAPMVAGVLASSRLMSARRARRVLPTVPVRVVDTMPS